MGLKGRLLGLFSLLTPAYYASRSVAMMRTRRGKRGVRSSWSTITSGTNYAAFPPPPKCTTVNDVSCSRRETSRSLRVHDDDCLQRCENDVSPITPRTRLPLMSVVVENANNANRWRPRVPARHLLSSHTRTTHAVPPTANEIWDQ
jgi:hypothetical protein